MKRELIQVSIAKNLRRRHAVARTNRAIARAIHNAATPAMRDELIIVSQRQFPSIH